MDTYFELALMARVHESPVILARLRDDEMLRRALRRAIAVAETQAREHPALPELGDVATGEFVM